MGKRVYLRALELCSSILLGTRLNRKAEINLATVRL